MAEGTREAALGTTHLTACGVCGRGGVWCYFIPGHGYVCVDRCAQALRDHEHCREVGYCWQNRYPCPELAYPTCPECERQMEPHKGWYTCTEPSCRNYGESVAEVVA